MAPLNLPTGAAGIRVKVQPVVLFSICDSFIRRNDGQDRVVGTLLGSVEAGVVEIRASYAVPHNETPDMVSAFRQRMHTAGVQGSASARY